jgi:hypothetical protein
MERKDKCKLGVTWIERIFSALPGQTGSKKGLT